MNPFDLDATGLMIWGLVLHLIADWPLQNDWMANNKAKRRERWQLGQDDQGRVLGIYYPVHSPWWDRHPAAYVHAGIHVIVLSVIFGLAALPLGLLHLIIDTRWPVVMWSKWIGQTQPKGEVVHTGYDDESVRLTTATLYDVGTEVRFWTDQVFHIICIAIFALVIG